MSLCHKLMAGILISPGFDLGSFLSQLILIPQLSALYFNQVANSVVLYFFNNRKGPHLKCFSLVKNTKTFSDDVFGLKNKFFS